MLYVVSVTAKRSGSARETGNGNNNNRPAAAKAVCWTLYHETSEAA